MTKPAFELKGRVEAVLVVATFQAAVSTPVPKIQVVRGHGVRGDKHAGVRLADVREDELLSFGLTKGMEIANFREVSIVSAEELTDVAAIMNLPQAFPHGCLSENIIIGGIPKLTQLPTGTMLFFRKDKRQIRTAVLVVWKENGPCLGPGEAIQQSFPDTPKLARLFPRAAAGKRGIVAIVYASGNIHVGDTVIAKIPKQRIYDPS